MAKFRITSLIIIIGIYIHSTVSEPYRDIAKSKMFGSFQDPIASSSATAKAPTLTNNTKCQQQLRQLLQRPSLLLPGPCCSIIVEDIRRSRKNALDKFFF